VSNKYEPIRRSLESHADEEAVSLTWDEIEEGTVALSATDAEPAVVGAATEHQFQGAHVFTMHSNTGFSAHLMPCVGWCGPMQQCRSK